MNDRYHQLKVVAVLQLIKLFFNNFDFIDDYEFFHWKIVYKQLGVSILYF